MKQLTTEMKRLKATLEIREHELVRALRSRDGIAIEKSADPMDEIQDASERDLAIRNADRESLMLRQVRTALQRIEDGIFGTCVECDLAINPKRLEALPWAARCIQCQEATDRARNQNMEPVREVIADAA